MRSTKGRCGERGPERGFGSVHNNSAHRSSISQPSMIFGNAPRKAAAAGRPWMISPMAPRRTISTRSTRLGDKAFSGKDIARDDTLTDVALGASESARWLNGLWDRPQFLLARRRRALRRARERSRRCNPYLWHESQGGFLGSEREHPAQRKLQPRLHRPKRPEFPRAPPQASGAALRLSARASMHLN